MLVPHYSIFLASPFPKTVKNKTLLTVLIQSPPSWIVWKKYQLHRATHERMWDMSTTSLSPNMGYVPLSLSGVSGVEWPSVQGLPNHRLAAPLPNLNLLNIGQRSSATDSSLVVKLNPQPQLSNWSRPPGSNLWGSLFCHNTLLVVRPTWKKPCKKPVGTDNDFCDNRTEGFIERPTLCRLALEILWCTPHYPNTTFKATKFSKKWQTCSNKSIFFMRFLVFLMNVINITKIASEYHTNIIKLAWRLTLTFMIC